MHYATFGLMAVGGLNWLVTGLYAAWDLGNFVTPMGARVVYLLVGLATVYELVMHMKTCKMCGKDKKAMPQMPPMAQ